MEMELFVLLTIMLLSFAAKENKNVAESAGNCGENVNENDEEIFVKIEEDEYAKINKKETSSTYIGVSYDVNTSKWRAQRHSKHEKKMVYNGHYEIEETAAHASDTLARKLIEDGESHKLNFPDDNTEVQKFSTYKKTTSSKYIGVIYREERARWLAYRHKKQDKKLVYNGHYECEETAAHASDTLARKLMANGEQNHKLNFPDDDTEERKTTSSKYIGVSYNVQNGNWFAQRRSKHEKKNVYNGHYKSKETAAHASDTLARTLMKNGENHKLNFPDDDTEVHPGERQRKRKRPYHEDLEHPKNN